MKNKLLIIGILALSLILFGCNSGGGVISAGEIAPTVVEEKEEVVVIPEDTLIQISGVGDIMVHGPQIRAQYDSQTKEYNFDNNFKYVKNYLQNTDLMLGNLETTFGGEKRGYSSYPQFNTPDALADSLKTAGFHAISTANNHSYDTGKEGLIRTVEVLQEKGLKTFGTRKDTEKESFVLMDVKGVTVGLSSYTYETPRSGEFKTINALKIPKDVESLIDTFSYEFLSEDLKIMEERVKIMKGQGAEIIVFYLHWGNEYHRQPNQYQKDMAQALANFGVDIIFGSHPHVIQPIEIIESQVEEQHQTVVVYSMGNFISNQRYEILNNRFTEDGVIVNVKLRKAGLTNEITLEEVTYVPTWVHRYFVEGKAIYEILPTFDVTKEPKTYGISSENSKWRVEHSQENTVKIIESMVEERGTPIIFSRN